MYKVPEIAIAMDNACNLGAAMTGNPDQLEYDYFTKSRPSFAKKEPCTQKKCQRLKPPAQIISIEEVPSTTRPKREPVTLQETASQGQSVRKVVLTKVIPLQAETSASSDDETEQYGRRGLGTILMYILVCLALLWLIWPLIYVQSLYHHRI
jgi:hypothetical protein